MYQQNSEEELFNDDDDDQGLFSDEFQRQRILDQMQVHKINQNQYALDQKERFDQAYDKTKQKKQQYDQCIKNLQNKKTFVSNQEKYPLMKIYMLAIILQEMRMMQKVSLQQLKHLKFIFLNISNELSEQLIIAKNEKRFKMKLEVILKILKIPSILNAQDFIIYTITLFRYLDIQVKKILAINLEIFGLNDKFRLNYSKIKQYGKKVKKSQKYATDKDNTDSRKSNSLKELPKIFQQDENFEDLEIYRYKRKKQNKPTQSLHIQSSANSLQWLDIFDHDARIWKLMNLRTLTIYTVQLAKKELEFIISIFIFGIKILNPKDQFKPLFLLRPHQYLELSDQTIRFCDNPYLIKIRRTKLDINKFLSELIIDLNSEYPMHFIKQSQIIANKYYESLIIKQYEKNKPKTQFQFKNSDHYVLPSSLGKFQMLKKQAVPIDGFKFQSQDVYLRTDIYHLHSRNGWVDVGRMVKQNQIPVKVSLTQKKKDLHLFTIDQTEPFQIRLKDGKFIRTNEYNNIYINNDCVYPPGVILIKQNVNYVCKKNNIECIQVIEGFQNHRPNKIGYFIFQKDKDNILKLYKQRKKYLQDKKQQQKLNGCKAIWKKLFTSILIKINLRQTYKNVGI